MHTRVKILLMLPVALAAPMAWSNGGSSMEESPENRAASEFNAGLRAIHKGDALQSDASKESDERARKKLLDRANDAYADARREFQDATRDDPRLPEAWNGLGYTQRRLGSYQDALASYDHALKLRPGFPEAIEYRGEAFLGVNRVEDAKQAYLALFATSRPLADHLLAVMRAWIGTRRQDGGLDAAALDDLQHWVEERTQIAAQTAALTRAGTAAAWK